MHIILLSGGSGRRLWPLSNEVRSKQFLKLFKKSDGQYESMVQRIYRQINKVCPDADITVATSEAQVSSIRNQLDDKVNLSLEPCRRDTFPAIALATAYLRDVRGVSEDETAVVCPVDPLVDDNYFLMLEKLSAQAEKGEANLVLMGIEPTYPSEKYGYIIPASQDVISYVSTFQEKPDVATAQQYIAQGALWNSGVFAYKLSYVLERARKLLKFTDYEELFERYETLEGISFDYAVVEKEPHIQMMRYCGEWKDLGTWNTLSESMEESIIGEGLLDQTCKNVHIINELDMPILAMGLKDVVISASVDGILVSDKMQSSYIKPIVDNIDRQVMFAEKSWGSYRVIDVGEGSTTIKVTLKPGHRMSYHSHKRRNELWTVIEGRGRTLIDGIEQDISVGDVINIEAGCRHTVFAETDLKLIEVQLGSEISVQDKEMYPLEI